MNNHFTTPTLRSLSNPSHQRWLVSRSLRLSAPPTYPYHLALHTRSFSSSPSRAAEPYNPVKEAEAKLKKQGKQHVMAGLSPEMQGLPLQDAYVLPPLYEVGISAVGGMGPSFKYVGKRLFRWFNTLRSVMTVGKAHALPRIPNRKMYQGFTMTSSTRPLVEELKEIYVRYNEAQANADISTLRSISQGQALKDAQSRLSSIPSGTSMKWEVQKWHGYPFHGRDQKLVNVRVIEADLKSEKQLGQIIVRFDSDQALTILQRNKSPVTRTSRVREYWAFERMISDRHARWKIRERIIPYSGGRMPLGMA